MIKLLSLFFALNQQNFIALQRQVAVFIAKMVGFAILCILFISEIFKVKPFGSHLLAGSFGFSGGV